MLPPNKAQVIFERMQRYPDYGFYVTEAKGQVIGTFALLVMDNLGHVGAPSLVAEDVAVDPAWQKQGVGKTMMRYVVKLCHEKGCYKLSLSSNLKRGHAHAFYQSLCFQRYASGFSVGL